MKYWYMLTGEINPISVGNAIEEIFRQLHENPAVEVTLYISSIGGDIDSAIRFYDFVKSSKVNLKTVGFGQVDSAAVILFLSGSERMLVKNCRVRLHQPKYNGPQQSQMLDVHTETTLFLQELDRRYFEIIVSEIGIAEDEARTLLMKGKILDPQGALDLKIATKVEEYIPIYR